MARQITVELEGAAELRAALLELPRRVARKVIRQATRKAARPILAQAKAEVPVDEGALQGSLKIRAIRRSRKLIGVIVRTASPAELGNPTARYAAAQEFGAPRRGMPASPYLRPAIIEKGESGLGIIEKQIRDGIAREAKKLAGSAPRAKK